MDEHFIILGLPRSMTAWVSCFLTCGEVFCQHELAGHFPFSEIPDKIRQHFPVCGVCDSGLLKNWEILKEEFPKARFAWIHRDINQIFTSLSTIGISGGAAALIYNNASVDMKKMAEALKPEIFKFNELQTEAGAKRLWNYCAPHYPLPPAHLRKMMSLKVTVHPKVYAEAAATLNQLTAA